MIGKIIELDIDLQINKKKDCIGKIKNIWIQQKLK
jgi:hypothetical protein